MTPAEREQARTRILRVLRKIIFDDAKPTSEIVMEARAVLHNVEDARG